MRSGQVALQAGEGWSQRQCRGPFLLDLTLGIREWAFTGFVFHGNAMVEVSFRVNARLEIIL